MSVSKEDSSAATEKKSSGDSGIISIIFSAIKKAAVVGIVYFAGYMQWSVAWFIGPIALFVIRDQWKKANDRKRNIAKSATLASEKDVVLARLDDLPAWVFFPDVERAEWINRIIKQIWPNINQFVRDIIRDQIQPNLRKNLEKYKLGGFKFERIILGTVPFRIGGVKIYDKNVARNEIIMDLDIFYAGDCDITFYLSGIKGGIRDFQLHGMLRIVMKPLITTIPLIGGLQIFFLNNPDIDFDLIGIADLLDMPGLSDILRRIVIETIASMMVLPNKFPIKLSDDIEIMELKAPEPEGVLRVHVVEAKNLMKKDVSMLGKGKSDPYAVITLGAQDFKTKVIDNTVDPKWDFWCEFNVLESDGQQLYIHIWDKDETSDDETLGRATVEVSNIVKKGQDDLWITLEQAKHGMIHLRLTWLVLSPDYSDLKAALEETQLLRVTSMSTALLTIFIDSARNLPQARASTKPDPYAVLRVGKNTQQTNVLMRTIHPVWEQGFIFLVPNPESDSLFLTIIDQKTTNELGTITYNISKLAKKNKMELYKEPFSLLKSGPESKIIWSMRLRILKKAIPSEDSTDAISINSSTDLSKPLIEEIPVAEEAKENLVIPPAEESPEFEEVIKDTVPALNSSEEGTELIHRTPSIISSSGIYELGRIQLTLRYSVQRQRLIVVIHKVANIPLKDPSNIPDPYVKLYLLPERSKDSKRRTQVIRDNCNPIFDETFEYILSQGELNTKQLEVTIASHKQLFYSGNNVLGVVVIEFSKLNLNQPYTSWFDLSPDA